MSKIIKLSEQKDLKHLIPVHVNVMRCDKYFWNWSTKHLAWIRGKKIPADLNKAYKNPSPKGCYKLRKNKNKNTSLLQQ